MRQRVAQHVIFCGKYPRRVSFMGASFGSIEPVGYLCLICRLTVDMNARPLKFKVWFLKFDGTLERGDDFFIW